VGHLFVAVLCYQFILDTLQSSVVYFHERAALSADQVIVVLVAVQMLEALRAVVKIDGSAKTGFGEQFQGPCNRCVTDPGVLLLYQFEQFLRRDMSFDPQENVDDDVSRSALSEILFSKKSCEFFFCVHASPR
jgi:ATP-dependent exoDNAse (exonuclease V) alpha subunit